MAAAWDDQYIDTDRDHPLVMRYNPPSDYLAPLGLAYAPDCVLEAAAQIAAIAIATAPERVSYSRNNNHYARRGRRYDERPDLYRRRIIIPAVDLLAHSNWIDNWIAPANPHLGWQSTFSATPALLDALRPLPPTMPKRRALIQLRNAQGQLEDFRDTERTGRMLRHLQEINEAVNSVTLELAVHIGECRGDFLVIDGAYVNLRQNMLWRIFNVEFKYGGRFYGPGAQTLPKALRQQLRLNGEPVAEPDYASHHIKILHALEGLQLTGSPYDIDAWPRDVVKRAVLVLLNAPTRRSAIGALTHDPSLGLDLGDARRLVQAVKHKHKPIENYFHSGIGCRLQRIDSDMTERVLLGLTRRGIPGLPVHDSYIVPAQYEGTARDLMDEAFETVINTYSLGVAETQSTAST